MFKNELRVVGCDQREVMRRGQVTDWKVKGRHERFKKIMLYTVQAVSFNK